VFLTPNPLASAERKMGSRGQVPLQVWTASKVLRWL